MYIWVSDIKCFVRCHSTWHLIFFPSKHETNGRIRVLVLSLIVSIETVVTTNHVIHTSYLNLSTPVNKVLHCYKLVLKMLVIIWVTKFTTIHPNSNKAACRYYQAITSIIGTGNYFLITIMLPQPRHPYICFVFICFVLFVYKYMYKLYLSLWNMYFRLLHRFLI